VSLSVALNLAQQQQNLSLGLCDSTTALYARSLLQGYTEAPTSAYTDTWHYNQGVAIKDTLAGSTARLGHAYNGKHLRLARAIAFVKGVGGFSLGTDFDQSELTLAQSIASFFEPAVLTELRLQAPAFTAAFDITPGNAFGTVGSWTAVNPDTDCNGSIVGFVNENEWLEWNKPANLLDGNYEVRLMAARGNASNFSGSFNGVPYSVPATGGWNNYLEQVFVPSLVVDSSVLAFRITFITAHNLEYVQLTRLP
jgi:hypothetical protein